MADKIHFHDEQASPTLRDYFAAHALGGYKVTVRDDMGIPYFEPAHKIAKRCYEIADEMMSAREE